MIKPIYFFALVCLTISSCYSNSIHEIKNTEDTKLIKLHTTKGDIVIKLFADKAPETVKNFLHYTKMEQYFIGSYQIL